MTLHTRTARLPYGYTVTFTAGMPVEGKLTMQDVRWAPDFPRIESRRARRKFHTAYTTARDEFVREVATMAGIAIDVFDIDGHAVIKPESRQ